MFFIGGCTCTSNISGTKDGSVISDGVHDQKTDAVTDQSLRAVTNPSLFEIAWDREVIQDGAPPLAALDFDGKLFSQASYHLFYRFDIEGKLVLNVDVPDAGRSNVGLSYLVPGPNGFGTVYQYIPPNDTEIYSHFGILSYKGEIDLAKGIQISERGGGSPSVVWNESLEQYLVHVPIWRSPTKTNLVNQWRFDASGKAIQGMTTLRESQDNPPYFFDDIWVGDTLMMLSSEGKKTPSGKVGSQLRLWALKPPYMQIDQVLSFFEDESLAVSGNTRGKMLTDGEQLFIAWREGYPGKPSAKAGLFNAKQTVTLTKRIVISDDKYVKAPLTAVHYKGHYIMVGTMVNERNLGGFYLTVYDATLKQVIPPTEIPLGIPDSQRNLVWGGKLFVSGDDLFLVYALDYDLPPERLLRFKLKGL